MTGLSHIDPWTHRDLTADHFRRAWRDLHGRAKPGDLSLADPDLLRIARHRGCSACDDDRHRLYVIRAGELVAETVIDEPTRDSLAAIQFRALGVQAGDVLISHHEHACAMDCFAEDADFLRAYRLTA